MFTSHIFIILAIFLLLKCNKEIEAPGSSVTGAASTAAKVQRSRTSSLSTSSASSATSKIMRESALKKVDLKPLIDIVRGEATAQTFSGGRIDPSVHGVQPRIQSAILRHSSRFFAGVGVGTGLIATGKLIADNFNNTATTSEATITTTTDADDIEDNF